MSPVDPGTCTSAAAEHQADWRQQIRNRQGDASAFVSYFDAAASVHDSYIQGAWDFSTHILKPQAIRLLGPPHGATALEIGFGGGRLLAAASRYFHKVVGVDIHDSFEQTRALLAEHGVGNAELVKGDGRTFPVPDESMDFVYSFIVLQHLPVLEVLQSNLAEVRRVLKVGKPAVLYFGYLPFRFGQKYRDLQTADIASSRENSLLLRPAFARRLLRAAGLRFVGGGRSVKKPWLDELGQQYYAVVMRP